MDCAFGVKRNDLLQEGGVARGSGAERTGRLTTKYWEGKWPFRSLCMTDSLKPCFSITPLGECRLGPRHAIRVQERRQRLGVSRVGAEIKPSGAKSYL